MPDFITEELSYRVNRIRDEQAHWNRQTQQRLTAIEDELRDLKTRIGALVRLLIAKQQFTAAEFATLVAEAQPAPAAEAAAEAESPTAESGG